MNIYNETNIIPCVIEGGFCTSYINALLSALFYKNNEHLHNLLISDPTNSSGYYLQEIIKTNYIEPLRRHYTIKSDILNEIRNYILINGYLTNESIINSIKSQSINKLYEFLLDYLNGNKLEFEIMKIKDGVLVDKDKDKTYKTSIIKFDVSKIKEDTSIKKLFLNWLNTEILKEQEDYYCYNLKNIPAYVSFYFNRNNNIMIDIMRKIKFFNNCDPTQNYIKYKIHSLICKDENNNYYSVLTTFNNKWIMLTENKIPSMEYIILNDDDLNEKIKKEVVFVMYTLD
jgi:hypothetical protein